MCRSIPLIDETIANAKRNNAFFPCILSFVKETLDNRRKQTSRAIQSQIRITVDQGAEILVNKVINPIGEKVI